jgi:hypothetical protein
MERVSNLRTGAIPLQISFLFGELAQQWCGKEDTQPAEFHLAQEY